MDLSGLEPEAGKGLNRLQSLRLRLRLRLRFPPQIEEVFPPQPSAAWTLDSRTAENLCQFARSLSAHV